jgi:membrane protein required for colicin V production
VTWIDAAIVIIFLYFIITAFNAGFVRETISTAAAILGAVLAGLFYRDVADTLFMSIDNQTTSSVVGFLVIFLGIAIAGQVLALLVHPAITILQLGIFDQMLGAAFGAVKAFIIVEVLLVLFVTYPRYHLDERIKDSQFGSLMVDGSAPIVTILPDIFDNKVNAFKD